MTCEEPPIDEAGGGRGLFVLQIILPPRAQAAAALKHSQRDTPHTSAQLSDGCLHPHFQTFPSPAPP